MDSVLLVSVRLTRSQTSAESAPRSTIPITAVRQSVPTVASDAFSRRARVKRVYVAVVLLAVQVVGPVIHIWSGRQYGHMEEYQGFGSHVHNVVDDGRDLVDGKCLQVPVRRGSRNGHGLVGELALEGRQEP